MIIDNDNCAAQSVLGYFGFDRTVYGDKRNATPRKWRWLQELKQQRKKISRQRWSNGQIENCYKIKFRLLPKQSLL